MNKVVKKLNHDSMWLKIGVVGSYVKLNVSRGGWKITTKGNVDKSIIDFMVARWKEIQAVKGSTHSQNFDILERELNEKFVK